MTEGTPMSSQSAPTTRQANTNIYFGFAPWIVFAVVASPSTWEFAALGALIVAVVLTLPDFRNHRVKFLDVAGIVFFAVLAVLALFLDRSDLSDVEKYASVISSAALAVIAFGSLAFMPFTEQYARESTPQEYWSSPLFKHINRVLTALWGLTFVLTAVCAYIAVEMDHDKSWFNWILPILILVLMVKFTEWYPDHAAQAAPDDASPA
jgi:hypothetical protein